MKYFFIALVLLPILTTGQQQDGKIFKIKGKLTQMSQEPEWVYLSYRVNGDYIVDSMKPVNNKYRFTGKITEPVIARLLVKNKSNEPVKQPNIPVRKDVALVFLEPGTLKANSVDSFSNVAVRGSKAHNDWEELNAKTKLYNLKISSLYAKIPEYIKAKDLANREKVENEITQLVNERNEEVFRKYISNNPNAPLAMYALSNYAGRDIDADKVEPLFNMLPASTQAWPSAIEFKEKMAMAKKTGIGKIAMDFTQNDTLGIPVTLSALRGKYLLVDFWASWCGPCRAENPNVVQAFNKYRDKGFHIIGVSLDNPGQKEKWMKAIHDDGLYWTQVSDLKGWKNEVSVMYGIQSIPQNLLLDPDGKIIAKNLRGDVLDSKLAEVIEKRSF